MVGPSPILNDKFWKILSLFEASESEISLAELKERVECPELTEAVVLEVISFLKNFSYDVKVRTEEGQLFVCPPNNNTKINIDLSFSEWLALQAHFPLFSQNSGEEFHKTIANKMAQIEENYPKYDLFKAIETEQAKQDVLKNIKSGEENVVNKIENCLNGGYLLQLSLSGERSLEVFPHKIVYLESDLTIIGEETTDRCLISLKISDVIDININIANTYSANFSSLEIDDFIYAMRAVAGNEERLVLKIKADHDIELQPPYHFLGNPYVTSNMEGDIIWAASVEVSDDLFEWLASIKDQVEILDPEYMKTEFDEFLLQHENSLKKAA